MTTTIQNIYQEHTGQGVILNKRNYEKIFSKKLLQYKTESVKNLQLIINAITNN